jgi:hypothetical protein
VLAQLLLLQPELQVDVPLKNGVDDRRVALRA